MKGPARVPALFFGGGDGAFRTADARDRLRGANDLQWEPAGLPALQSGEPGQARKEAATAGSCKCRGSGSPHISLDAMSYQVLARKWRPKDFSTLVGQEHVVRALRHALESKRLHHAYLFTGTRGVGKTTLARILAKCLDCETGVTAQPCGKC